MTINKRGVRILHLSDTHLFGDDTLHHGRVDTLAALRRVLTRAAEIDAIDVIVASGDLSDDGSERSYRRLREDLDPWATERGAIVVYAMGNHDLADGFVAVLGQRHGIASVAGLRVIHLDSAVPGAAYGAISAEQLTWLRETLGDPSPDGSIVVVHHPPVPASTSLLAELELQNPAKLMEICASGDVRAVLCGHYHHSLVSERAGVPVIVAPGIANTSDAIAPAGSERATIGAGFAIVDLPANGGLRASFIRAPGPEDGVELFHLTPAEIERISRESGPPR